MASGTAIELRVGDSVLLKGQSSLPYLTVTEIYTTSRVTGKEVMMAEVVYNNGLSFARDRFPVDALERANNG